MWLAGGGRRAGASRSDLIAGLTGAAAGGVAADAVGAMLGVALARRPRRQRRWPLGPQLPPRHLTGATQSASDGAGRLALIGGRVAKEGGADGDRARAASAGAVANEGAGDLGPLTGPGRADRAQGVASAGPLAVAGSVLTAGRLRLDLALTRVARRDAGRDHRAHAERARLRAGLAGSLAGAVAAVSLDAELALALGGAAAREAVVSVRVATRGIRAARPGVAPASGLRAIPP